MTDGERAGIERRTAPRAAIRSQIDIVYPDLERLAQAICSDLSVGGMFIETEAPLPVGAPVRFDLHLPGRLHRKVSGDGVVVWRRDRRDLADPPPGFGVQFTRLDPRFRALIFRLVDGFIQRGGEPFDLDDETS
jgi:uncharacterized protein (TIGR02266 family)